MVGGDWDPLKYHDFRLVSRTQYTFKRVGTKTWMWAICGGQLADILCVPTPL